MKVKKAPLIVLAIFAVLCIALGVYVILPKSPPSPVIISEKIEIVEASEGNYVWRGKIKNISEETVWLSDYDFEVHLKTNDEYYEQYGPLKCNLWFAPEFHLELAPNEEYDLSNESFDGGIRIPEKVIKVCLRVDGYNYVLYGNSLETTQIVFAVILFVSAVVFIGSGLGIFIAGKNRVKRIAQYGGLFNFNDGSAVYLSGSMGDKTQEKRLRQRRLQPFWAQ